MKSKYLILLIPILFLTSCNEISKSFSSNSDKNAAIKIVNYYNLVFDYDSKTGNNIKSLVDGDLTRLNKMVKSKRKDNSRIRWNNFNDYGSLVEVFNNNTTVNILEPKTFLEEQTAKEVGPLIKEMDNSYNGIKKAFLDFKDYYNKEEYKNDEWKKGATLTKIMEDEIPVYLSNRNNLFTMLEPIVTKAEEASLAGHPLEKELVHLKRTLTLAEKTLTVIAEEKIDMDAVIELSNSIKTRIEDGKSISKSNLEEYKKEHEFKSFYNVTGWFSDDLEKAIKSKRIVKYHYELLESHYGKMIQYYNLFVQ